MFKQKEVITETPLELNAVVKLTKDLKEAAATLGPVEARFLVKQYYTAQENRIAARHQSRTLQEQDMPFGLLQWVGDQHELIELQLKNALDKWTSANAVGRWAKSITGIGPVISAGLLAHIDITKAPAASSVWRFAGIDPTIKWEKGKKRPWNAELKVLTVFKAGESFVKTQNLQSDFYGKIFAIRKAIYAKKNEDGGFAETAANLLAVKKYGKDTEAYKAMITGKLSKAHIHAMARRYTIRIFLSHYHEVLWWATYGTCSPLPYPIVHLQFDHVHYIDVPNMNLFPGFAEARKQSLIDFRCEKGKRVTNIATPQKLSQFYESAANDLEDTQNSFNAISSEDSEAM